MINANDLHVFYCLYRDFPGNSSTAYYNYARCLVEQGVRVTVVAGNDRKSAESKDRKFISGVDVYRLETKLNDAMSVHPTWFAMKAFWLISRLAQDKANSILHQIAFPNLGLVLQPPPFFRLPKRQVLDIRATAVRREFLDRLSCKIIKFQAGLFKNVLVISEEVAKRLKLDSYDVLPIGVNLSLFKRDEVKRARLRGSLGLKDTDLLLVYVGHLNPSRRLDLLLRSFWLAKSYIKNAMGTDLSMMIIGGGSDFERLRNIAKSGPCQDRTVYFVGPKPHDEIPAYLSAADVGIAYIPETSQYFYQPPIKTYEYLASGLCTIATRTLGNLRVIADGDNGILSDYREEAIANAIIKVAANPELRKKLSDNARQSISEYDYRRIVAKILVPYYERICR